ncbi:MAG TPA: hypothetical protein EYG85_03040 [Crocinitomix sp.]|nr:hypothetical protein [Crocinitomix sp.]
MKKLLLGIVLGFVSTLNAQVGLGTIKGKVYNADSTSLVLFKKVSIEVDGNFVGTQTDIDGVYEFKNIKPGVYTIKIQRDTNFITFSGVEVNPDQITMMNLYLPPLTSKVVTIIVDRPKIDINPVQLISREELEGNINIRNPMAIISTKMSDVKLTQDNQVIIRGSRAGDVVYFVDGVKMTSMQSVPGVAIRGISVYTGGIPAKYGDTTGGVIVLETVSYFDLYYQWKANNNK